MPRKTVTITTEQIEAALERLRSGTTTIKAEAEQLGVSYTALRRVLEQVVGLDTYFTLVAACKQRRMKLPPSKDFLTEQVEDAASIVDTQQGKTA